MTVLLFRRRSTVEAPLRRGSGHPAKPTAKPAESVADLFAQAYEIDRDDPDEGMRLYRRVLQLDPRYDLAMSNLADLFFYREQYGAAETWWLRALEANPKQPEAHYNLGYLRVMQGAYTSAVDFFDTAISINEDFSEAHFNLADTLEKMGRRREARVHWRRYVQLGGPFVEKRWRHWDWWW